MFDALKLVGLIIILVTGVLSALAIAAVIGMIAIPTIIGIVILVVAYMIAKEIIYGEY